MFVFKASTLHEIRSLAFSPDGRYLLADRFMYELNTQTNVKEFNFFTSSGDKVSFSEDGRFIFHSAFIQGTKITEIETNITACLKSARTECSFLLGPKQQILTTRSGFLEEESTNTSLWDISTPLAPKLIWQKDEIKASSCLEIAASPDLQTYAVIERTYDYQSKTLVIYRFDTGELVRKVSNIPRYISYRDLCFHPTEEYLMLLGDKSISLRNIETGKVARTIIKPNSGSFKKIAAHPNGRAFVTLHRSDGMVHVWNAETFEVSHSYQWPIKKGASLAISPDGLMCAVGDSHGNIVVWDWED